MVYYVELAVAIVGEVIGSNLLKLSDGFAKIGWGGAGIILTCIASYFIFHETATPWQLVGIALIVIGVFIANYATK